MANHTRQSIICPGCRKLISTSESHCPYCGLAARTGVWEPEIPALFLLGRNDETAPAAPCIVMAEDLRDSGRVAEAHVYEGVGHGFDHPNRPGDPDSRHSPNATAQAHSALLDFLARHAANSDI